MEVFPGRNGVGGLKGYGVQLPEAPVFLIPVPTWLVFVCLRQIRVPVVALVVGRDVFG